MGEMVLLGDDRDRHGVGADQHEEYDTGEK
jgi:hypothetical protein